jgi:hypothetical protein
VNRADLRAQLVNCKVDRFAKILNENGSMTEEMREVRLPAGLCAAAEKRFSQTFAHLEELLIFVLRDLASDGVSALDQAEQRLVEQRLRELGYL